MNRLPAHIASLRRLLDRELSVELIAEPLHAVEEAAPCADVRQALEAKGFDECGVRRDGAVRDFARGADMTGGTVGEHAKPVPLERVVAPSTALWTCMGRLASHGPLYVLGDRGLDGIVTVADLNKQPARLLLFGIISMLEMTMTALVRTLWPGDTWRACLTPERIEMAEKLHNERRRRGHEIDLLDCIQLGDKLSICLKTEPVLKAWGGTRNGTGKLFASLQQVRDNLAHAQSPAPDGDWSAVLKSLKEGHEILDRSVLLLQTPGGVV